MIKNLLSYLGRKWHTVRTKHHTYRYKVYVGAAVPDGQVRTTRRVIECVMCGKEFLDR